MVPRTQNIPRAVVACPQRDERTALLDGDNDARAGEGDRAAQAVDAVHAQDGGIRTTGVEHGRFDIHLVTHRREHRSVKKQPSGDDSEQGAEYENRPEALCC